MAPRRQIDLKALIRQVRDFPKPGVLFRDITPLLLDAEAYAYVVEELARHIEALSPEAIAGIESRGFLLGAPVAYRLGLPFVPIRKAGKLPSERMSVEFSLEYGESQLDMHVDALARGQRAVIVDDLLATGGTAEAAAKLVQMAEATVAGIVCLVELPFLVGRKRLADHKVVTLIRYDE